MKRTPTNSTACGCCGRRHPRSTRARLRYCGRQCRRIAEGRDAALRRWAAKQARR